MRKGKPSGHGAEINVTPLTPEEKTKLEEALKEAIRLQFESKEAPQLCEGTDPSEFTATTVDTYLKLVDAAVVTAQSDSQRLKAFVGCLKTKVALKHGELMDYFDALNRVAPRKIPLREVNRGVRIAKDWLSYGLPKHVGIGQMRKEKKFVQKLDDGRIFKDLEACGGSLEIFKAKYNGGSAPITPATKLKRALSSFKAARSEMSEQEILALEHDVTATFGAFQTLCEEARRRQKGSTTKDPATPEPEPVTPEPEPVTPGVSTTPVTGGRRRKKGQEELAL